MSLMHSTPLHAVPSGTCWWSKIQRISSLFWLPTSDTVVALQCEVWVLVLKRKVRPVKKEKKMVMKRPFSIKRNFPPDRSVPFTFPAKFLLLLNEVAPHTTILKNGSVSFSLTGHRGPPYRQNTLTWKFPLEPKRSIYFSIENFRII